MRVGRRENVLFLYAHAFLLGVVLVGFARTFYLQPWLGRNALDAALVLHGTALSSWFVLAFVQALLIVRGRRPWHRRTAWLAAGIVPALIVSSLWINSRVAMRIETAADPQNMFVWGNYMSLVAFVSLVVAAVVRRHDGEAHRRLLLLASIAIVGPAFARFAFWPAIGLGIAGGPPFAIGGMLLLLAAVIGHDLRVFGRVHGATFVGVAAIVTTIVLALAIAQSGIVFEVARAR